MGNDSSLGVIEKIELLPGCRLRSLIILIKPAIPWQSKRSEWPTGRTTTSPSSTVALTFWLDEPVIQAWNESGTPSSRDRPQHYSDLVISTVLMITCSDLSLNNVTDAEAFPGFIRQTYRKINAVAADGAYDTRRCHDDLRQKKIRAPIPPRTGVMPIS